MDWQVIISTKSSPTVLITTANNKKFYLHSRYDPLKEAETWVDSQLFESSIQQITVIGIGLGYHLKLLAEKYSNIQIDAFEFNYSFITWAIKNEILTDLTDYKNISLHFEKDIQKLLFQFSKRIKDAKDNLLIYKPSLRLIENEAVRTSLESFYLKKQTIKDQKDSLIQNFDLNMKLSDKGISSFLEFNRNSSVILVSAGPSLQKQIPLLKKTLKKGFVIASVGTALTPLIKAGIKPNLIMISDPKDLIIEQLKGMENLEVPLFYLSTANHTAVKNYKGPRYIVWQNGFYESELQGKKNNEPLIETGGSVATCLLDLLVKLDFKNIALVGQDLAFTNNESHTLGTHLYRKVENTDSLLKIDDYYLKGKIATSRNLSIYLKWFERYIDEHKGIQFFNCTEGGAHIKGWKHVPLYEFMNSLHI